MTRGFGRFLRHNTIALLALFIALGGTSFAAATLLNGSQIKPHTIARNRLTNKAIKQLKGNRGARGAPGAQGAPGTQGPQGVQGPAGPGARWAAVGPGGGIARQSGGITVTNPSPGIYLVDFGVDVSHQLITVSDAVVNDGSFRGVSIAGTCGDVDTFSPTFCTAVLGATTPANDAVVFTTDSTNANEVNHSFFISAIGPNGAASPSGANRAQHAVPNALAPAGR